MPSLTHQPVLNGFDDPLEVEEVASESARSAEAKPCGVADQPPDLTGKTVYLVDSHSLIYQVFHAIPEMTGPNGQPVAAVQGFVRDLLDLIEVRKADYLICAFDAGDRTFRHTIYERYKVDRKPMPI